MVPQGNWMRLLMCDGKSRKTMGHIYFLFFWFILFISLFSIRFWIIIWKHLCDQNIFQIFFFLFLSGSLFEFFCNPLSKGFDPMGLIQRGAEGPALKNGFSILFVQPINKIYSKYRYPEMSRVFIYRVFFLFLKEQERKHFYLVFWKTFETSKGF